MENNTAQLYSNYYNGKAQLVTTPQLVLCLNERCTKQKSISFGSWGRVKFDTVLTDYLKVLELTNPSNPVSIPAGYTDSINSFNWTLEMVSENKFYLAVNSFFYPDLRYYLSFVKGFFSGKITIQPFVSITKEGANIWEVESYLPSLSNVYLFSTHLKSEAFKKRYLNFNLYPEDTTKASLTLTETIDEKSFWGFNYNKL
jgi:hypothetical protein